MDKLKDQRMGNIMTAAVGGQLGGGVAQEIGVEYEYVIGKWYPHGRRNVVILNHQEVEATVVTKALNMNPEIISK